MTIQSSVYRELLLGCGYSRIKRLQPGRFMASIPREWQNLSTIDINAECDPTWVVDLAKPEQLQLIDSNEFDEIHAYEVLEHCGQQGDYDLLFRQFSQFWRMLKPGGFFCATVPDWKSMWAWGDPGHTRIISQGTLVFLNKSEYDKQLGLTTMSDYRKQLGETNFHRVYSGVRGETFEFILRAIK